MSRIVKRLWVGSKRVFTFVRTNPFTRLDKFKFTDYNLENVKSFVQFVKGRRVPKTLLLRMESNGSPERREEFHEIHEEINDLCVLMKVQTWAGVPENFNVIEIAAEVEAKGGVAPLGVTPLGENEAVLEFPANSDIITIARRLHNRGEWQHKIADISCTIAEKEALMKVFEERRYSQMIDHKIGLIKSEQKRQNEQVQATLEDLKEDLQGQSGAVDEVRELRELLGHLQDRIGTLERGPVKTEPRSSISIDVGGSPKERKPPALPVFSGSDPVPRDEGNFEQWFFQVQGYLATHTERAMRSAIVGSVRGEARDLVEYIGLEKPLEELLSRLEKRFGQGKIKDKLQADFFQTVQNKGEGIQQFAGRLEKKFKLLDDNFPGRYSEGLLKERLFHGMVSGLKNTVRFMYKAESSNYETLLEAAREAEAEFHDNKSAARMKSANLIEGDKDKLETLESKIENLTLALKAGTLVSKNHQGSPKKGSWKKEGSQSQPTTPSKGPEVTSHGPFRGKFKDPRQCHRCRGWGHIRPDCPTRLNSEGGRSEQSPPPTKRESQDKTQ